MSWRVTVSTYCQIIIKKAFHFLNDFFQARSNDLWEVWQGPQAPIASPCCGATNTSWELHHRMLDQPQPMEEASMEEACLLSSDWNIFLCNALYEHLDTSNFTCWWLRAKRGSKFNLDLRIIAPGLWQGFLNKPWLLVVVFYITPCSFIAVLVSPAELTAVYGIV